MWNRLELKARGRAAFQKNYLPAVAVTFLMGFISLIFSGGSNVSRVNIETNRILNEGAVYQDSYFYFSPRAAILTGMFTMFMFTMAIVMLLLKIFVEYALQIGGKQFFIQNQTSQPPVGVILNGFRTGHYGNILVTMLLKDLFIVLWTFLFVIPGIIKSYEYMMVPYILAENPGMDRREVFQISKEMMDGHKWDAFILDLSFIGWELLSFFTCGLLSIFFINPYREATYAEVYRFNKQMAFERGYIK